MNKKVLIVVALIVVVSVPLFLHYFSTHPNLFGSSTPTPSPASQTSPADSSLTKIYSGTLPCADCTGIETNLSLTQKDKNTAEGSFTKSEMYIGKDTDAKFSKGNWTTERGDNSDPDATVIVLNPSDPENVERYLQVDPTKLEKLDKSGNRIQGDANYTLTLVQ